MPERTERHIADLISHTRTYLPARFDQCLSGLGLVDRCQIGVAGLLQNEAFPVGDAGLAQAVLCCITQGFAATSQ